MTLRNVVINADTINRDVEYSGSTTDFHPIYLYGEIATTTTTTLAPTTTTTTTVMNDATVYISSYSGYYDGNPHGATGTAEGIYMEDLSAFLYFGPQYTDPPGGLQHWTFSGATGYWPQSGDIYITIHAATTTTTTLSPTTTTTTLAPTTTTTTTSALSFYSYYSCEGNIYLHAESPVGGTETGYEFGTTVFDTESEALANTSWSATTTLIYNLGYILDGTWWIVLRDSGNNMVAISVVTDCRLPQWITTTTTTTSGGILYDYYNADKYSCSQCPTGSTIESLLVCLIQGTSVTYNDYYNDTFLTNENVYKLISSASSGTALNLLDQHSSSCNLSCLVV